jgi:hypothetical protein
MDESGSVRSEETMTGRRDMTNMVKCEARDTWLISVLGMPHKARKIVEADIMAVDVAVKGSGG